MEGGKRKGSRHKDWIVIPCQPEETLSGHVLLGLELVDDELLQSGGLSRSLGVALVNFLRESNCQRRV